MHETFIINIRYNQNATWQGDVKWVQGQKSQTFRSALELIHLLDSAVADNPYHEWKEESESPSEQE